MSEDIYGDETLHIGAYCGPAGEDRKRFQITSWCDGQRSHVQLTRAQAVIVLVKLAEHFKTDDDITAEMIEQAR